ncbi:hypothetical protein U1Q18_014319 [Sarracenia purpurea var. burkii]
MKLSVAFTSEIDLDGTSHPRSKEFQNALGRAVNSLSSRREQQNVESKESALPRKCNFDAIDSTLPTEV